MKKFSVNLRNDVVWFKQCLGETLLSFQKKLDHVRTEYVEIVNASKISKGKDEIDDVWNESNNEKVPGIKCG